MDPEACLRRIFDAFESKDWDEFDGAYTDLWQWISRGGFLPKSFNADPELREAFGAGEQELRVLLAQRWVRARTAEIEFRNTASRSVDMGIPIDVLLEGDALGEDGNDYDDDDDDAFFDEELD